MACCIAMSTAAVAAGVGAATATAVTYIIHKASGSEDATTHVYNATNQPALVTNCADGREWILSKKQHAKFKQKGSFVIKVELVDSEQKATVSSSQNESWIITKDGVIRQQMGQALNVRDTGPLFQWKRKSCKKCGRYI